MVREANVKAAMSEKALVESNMKVKIKNKMIVSAICF